VEKCSGPLRFLLRQVLLYIDFLGTKAVLHAVRDSISDCCIVCYHHGPVQSPATPTSQAILFYYRYAFFRNAQSCYCGDTNDGYRPAECLKLCRASDSASCEVLDTGWIGMLHESPSSF
jgi:hypothetical protein